jgi:hypothetical protein
MKGSDGRPLACEPVKLPPVVRCRAFLREAAELVQDPQGRCVPGADGCSDLSTADRERGLEHYACGFGGVSVSVSVARQASEWRPASPSPGRRACLRGSASRCGPPACPCRPVWRGGSSRRGRQNPRALSRGCSRVLTLPCQRMQGPGQRPGRSLTPRGPARLGENHPRSSPSFSQQTQANGAGQRGSCLWPAPPRPGHPDPDRAPAHPARPERRGLHRPHQHRRTSPDRRRRRHVPGQDHPP